LQVAFLPFVFLMAGHWSPKKAAEEAKAHGEMVERELAEMTKEETGEVEAV
jgi:ACS family D-galactonate transporter-like MFS transporter